MITLLNYLDFDEYLTKISHCDNTLLPQGNPPYDFKSADFVLTNLDKITNTMLNQYLKSRLQKYILNQDNEPAFVLIDTNRQDLPNWASSLVARGTKLYKFDSERISEKLKKEITAVCDYLYLIAYQYIETLATNNKTKKIKIRYDYLKTLNEYKTFEMALTMANTWHKNLAAKIKRYKATANTIKESLNGTKFIMNLPGDMKVYKLVTDTALDFESIYMGHCIGKGKYDKSITNDRLQIYSIRDKNYKPHITLKVQKNTLQEVRGARNNRPKAKYIPAIQAFISSKKINPDYCLQDIGILKQNNKYYNIFQLPKNFVVLGDIDLTRMVLEELPDMSTVTVMGHFMCNHNQLKSLQGAPRIINGDFICSYNQLTTLQGAPQTVGGDFLCNNNELTSLQGAPQTIGKDFSCNNNELTSLENAPKTVGSDFFCCNNKLMSLHGKPTHIQRYFYWDNKLLSERTDSPDITNELNTLMKLSKTPTNKKLIMIELEKLLQRII